MSSLAELIAAGARRVGLMRSAVGSLDDRITRLEEERRTAEPHRAFMIGQELRQLSDERLAGNELLFEAEHRAAENAAAFRQREDTAIKELHTIRGKAVSAAQKVDRLLAEVCDAIEEVERICEPLDKTLLPDGTLKRYCSGWAIWPACRKAFASRLGRAEQMQEAKSFAQSISWMTGTVASDNAASIRRQREAAKVRPS
jgi:hypothetical protein